VALRDPVLLQLAAQPDPADAPRFWIGLSSPSMEVTRSCAAALLKLPAEQRGTNLVACLSALRQWIDFPEQVALRAQLLSLLTDQTGEKFEIKEPETIGQPLLARAASVRAAWKPLFDWLNRKRPELARQTGFASGFNPIEWQARLKLAPWSKGDPERGRQLAVERGCAACHAAAEPFGPPLEGLAARLGRDDLFGAIIHPAHEVEDALRPTAFILRQGATYTGWAIYDAPEWTLVQTGPLETVRLAGPDIAARLPSQLSFMPYGLLDDLPPQALADLYRFLAALK
jgi:putative heme-binding domain-containing protein